VKKLRRLGIADDLAANAFLEMTYLPDHNARFAQRAASTDDFHRRTPSRLALDRAFQLEETRVVSNDWVIRYDTRFFQIARQSGHAPARSTVLVRENAAGAIELRYRGRVMHWSEIPAPPSSRPSRRRRAGHGGAGACTRATARPVADHPWHHGVEDYRTRLQVAAAKRAWMAGQP